MIGESFGALVCNTALLLLLVYVYDLLNVFHWVSRAWIRQVIGGVVSDAICALVIGMVWLQHRRSSPGLGLWTAGFALQTVSLLLIALRGPGLVYGYKAGPAARAWNKENSRRVLQRWGALLGCVFLTFGYISFICYESSAFNCGRTPSLVGA